MTHLEYLFHMYSTHLVMRVKRENEATRRKTNCFNKWLF